MFIGGWVLGDGAGVQPGLVRKGRRPDIGQRAQGHAVDDVIQLARDFQQMAERLGRDAGFEPLGIGGLQRQRRDQRGQAGIAAALPQPVQRALDLARAGVDRRQGAGHRLPRVVMAMNAQMVAGDAAGDDGFGNGADFAWQRAAIGVAQHDPPRARVMGGVQGLQRVIGVGLVAVEEMFRVEMGFAVCATQWAIEARMLSRFSVQRDPKRMGDVVVMRLADKADRFCPHSAQPPAHRHSPPTAPRAWSCRRR